jgi:hypothetical protein
LPDRRGVEIKQDGPMCWEGEKLARSLSDKTIV